MKKPTPLRIIDRTYMPEVYNLNGNEYLPDPESTEQYKHGNHIEDAHNCIVIRTQKNGVQVHNVFRRPTLYNVVKVFLNRKKANKKFLVKGLSKSEAEIMAKRFFATDITEIKVVKA